MKNVHTNAGVQKLLHNLLLRISIFPALSRSEGEKRRGPGNSISVRDTSHIQFYQELQRASYLSVLRKDFTSLRSLLWSFLLGNEFLRSPWLQSTNCKMAAEKISVGSFKFPILNSTWHTICQLASVRPEPYSTRRFMNLWSVTIFWDEKRKHEQHLSYCAVFKQTFSPYESSKSPPEYMYAIFLLSCT